MKTHVAIFLVIASCNAGAQTVYKCPGDNGTTVYSQRPCSTDQSKVEQITVRAPATPGVIARENSRNVSRGNARSQLAIDEALCIDVAIDNFLTPSDERIERLEADIRRLQARVFYSSNTAAAATLEAGLGEQIAALQLAIAHERTSAQRLADIARQRCIDDRRRGEADLVQHASEEEEAVGNVIGNE